MDYPVEAFTDEECTVLSRHFTNLDQPERFNGLLREFLSRL
jgi:hypothetical protein